MLATGARCRSMWLAARGDVPAAMRVAEEAMAEHARFPLPFERARTQLAEMLGYTGLEVGTDEVMLAAAGPRGRRPATVA